MLIPDITYITKDYVEGGDPASILFTDITSGDIESWAWTLYIDGVESTTGDESTFIVDYSTGDEYTVSLEVTDSEGSATIQKVFLILDGEHWRVFQSIIDMVKYALGEDIDWDFIQVSKAKFQELFFDALQYLFIEVDIEEGVDVTHDERFWPPLGNLLISYLVIRDFMTNNLNATLTGGSTSVTTPGGEVTSIVTGPTEVMFSSSSSSLANTFKEVEGGSYALIQSQLCALSQRLRVHVQGCPSPPILPKRQATGYTGYAAWEIVNVTPVSQA